MKPMHYATHVVSPVLGLMNKPAEYVSCFGSGKISEDLQEKLGCPFAVQSAHIKLKDSDVSAHIYCFLFDTARQYRESFDAYGSKKSFEWPLIEGEDPVLHTAKKPDVIGNSRTGGRAGLRPPAAGRDPGLYPGRSL